MSANESLENMFIQNIGKYTIVIQGRKFLGLFLNSGLWGWLSKESQPINSEFGLLK